MASLQRYPAGQKFRGCTCAVDWLNSALSPVVYGDIALSINTQYNTTLQRYPPGQKFRRNSSIWHGFRDISIFVFCNFCKKFENSKWPTFWGDKIFFKNWDGHCAEIPCGSKISSKSLYLARFSRYKHFCVLQFLREFRKLKMADILGERNFFKIGIEIPCGSKISSKSLYLAWFSRYKHVYVLQFFAKNSKWLPFWMRQIYFENCDGQSAEVSWRSKILSK